MTDAQINLRLSRAEAADLDALVAHTQADMDEHGLPVTVTRQTMLRALISRAADDRARLAKQNGELDV